MSEKMKKVAKIKGIVSRSLQLRYFNASEEERHSLLPLIAEERRWMIEQQAAKGYQLEGTVAEVLGIFTRGPAVGTLKVHAVSDVRSGTETGTAS